MSIDQYGRAWCDSCGIEIGEGQSVTDYAALCSDYCRGRWDERIWIKDWLQHQPAESSSLHSLAVALGVTA